MTDATKPDSSEGPSPRAFCHASGLVFMLIGAVLSMVTCCLWPATQCWQDRLPLEGLQAPDVWRDAPPALLWAMAAVAISFVSGMALAAIGLGLRYDRRGTARAAFWLTGSVATFFWCYLGFAIFQFPTAGRIAIAALMSIVWTVCFLLAGVSAQEHKRFPPPRPSEPAWTSRDEDDLRRTSSPRSPDKTSR